MEKVGLRGTSLKWIHVENLRTYSLPLPGSFLNLYKLYSRTSINGHLSTVASTLQETYVFFSVPVDSPYIRDVTKTRNWERGTGNTEPGTGVWERMYSGNPPKNSTWRTKEKKREQKCEEVLRL